MDTLQVNDFNSIGQFLGPLIINISIVGFLINLLLCAFFGFWLANVYKKYGKSLSNRAGFSNNFYLLMMTTMLIITVIQQSLALSLGLVGALSIVRFRAAIKEPEELSYLFLCIALGLGFGAGQRIITMIAFIVIVGIIRYKNKNIDTQLEWAKNIYLTITSSNTHLLNTENIVKVINMNCSNYRTKRIDESKDLIEASFLIEFIDENTLNKINASLRKVDKSVQVTFLDFRGQSLAE